MMAAWRAARSNIRRERGAQSARAASGVGLFAILATLGIVLFLASRGEDGAAGD